MPGGATTNYFEVLARASAALAPALESIDGVLDDLGAALVPDIADWFALHLFSEGALETAVARGTGATTETGGRKGATVAAERRSLEGLAAVVAGGDIVRVDGLTAGRDPGSRDERWWRELGLDSVVMVPVRTRGLTLGALSVGTTKDRGRLTDADVDLVGAVAGRVAVALERVAQHRQTEETARDAARQATRLRHLMEAAVVLGGAGTEEEVIHRLAAAARRVSGSTGAAVVIERGPGAPVKTVDGTLPEDTVQFALFDSNRTRVGGLVVGAPATDPEGFELAVVALAQIGGALVENRRLLDSLDRSRGHLQALVDASPDAIVELDADGLVLTANRAAGTVLGRPLPVRLGSFVDEHWRPTFEENLAKAVADLGPPRFEVTADRDGEPIVLSIALAPLVNDDRTERIVALISDVTDQRRMEEQFLRAQRMEAIGRLAGGIAHDFNNLITAIIGFGEMAAGSLPPDHRANDDIHEVVAAGRRAAELTAQLLTLGSGQAVDRTNVDVTELLAGMQRMLERVLPADVSLEIEVANGLQRVRGDRGQLEQVLLNLAINASDAMPSGGRLTISAAPSPGEPASSPASAPSAPAASDHGGTPGRDLVRLTVSDTGTGMDPLTAERCFEPFFTTKEQGRGTGLGLSAVYGIVTQHQGSISVSSTPGEGTTFTLELPAAAGAQTTAVRLADAPQPGTETVLLVEDQSSVRSLLSQVLQSRGYRVLVAEDADDAMNVVRTEGGQIDLLLTDIVMPGMSGADLADRVHDEMPGLRVLFISGYARGALEQRGSIDGDVAFLAKPFNPDALARRVREVLDGPAPPPHGSKR